MFVKESAQKAAELISECSGSILQVLFLKGVFRYLTSESHRSYATSRKEGVYDVWNVIKICHESTICHCDMVQLTIYEAELCRRSCLQISQSYTLWMRTGDHPFLAGSAVSLFTRRADEQAACAVVCQPGFDSITAFTADLSCWLWNQIIFWKNLETVKAFGQKVILIHLKKTICVRNSRNPL